jgi:hypothetical protein
MAAVVSPTSHRGHGGRAAGFALTWPTFTTPIRGTDLAGPGRARPVTLGGRAAARRRHRATVPGMTPQARRSLPV